MKEWYCPKLTILVVNILAIILLTSIAVGQETTEKMSAESDEGETEEVIEIECLAIIGSRLQARSVEDSAVPIDILGSDEFIKQGGTDLRDLM
jgi:iron complex outermembrane receptor protein